MSDETKVRELLAPLLTRPVELEAKQPQVNEQQVVDTILRAARAPAASPAAGFRSRSSWLLAAACLLLVASAVAVWGRRAPEPAATAVTGQPQPSMTLRVLSGSVTNRQAGASVVLQPAATTTRLAAADELVTAAASRAQLERHDGLQLELLENSRLSLAGSSSLRADSSVRLLAGTLRCRVPALARDDSFTVVTPNASVIVLGTAFSVAVAESSGATQTCVKVEEGVVLLKTPNTEQTVHVGQSWGCDPQPASAARQPQQRVGSEPVAAPLTAGRAKASLAQPSKLPSGTLEEENRLFQAGLSAERSGNLRAAATAFQDLLRLYPESPLAAEARRAHSRVARSPKTQP